MPIVLKVWSGYLLEMKTLRPQQRYTESDALSLGPIICILKDVSVFLGKLKCDNQTGPQI